MKPLAIRSSPMHQDDGLSIWDKFAGARSILGSIEAGLATKRTLGALQPVVEPEG